MKQRRWFVHLFALLLAMVLTGDRSSSAAGAQLGEPLGATQTSQQGAVTVAVTWTGVEGGAVFTVVLDTHSVNLDSYNLAQLAVLRTDRGQESLPTVWDAPAGSHHREGSLRFPETASDGSLLLGADASSFELVVRDVGGVPERVFRWTN
jgi:hypothetical protein